MVEVVTPDDTSYVSVEVCGENCLEGGESLLNFYFILRGNEGCAVYCTL